MKEETTIKKPVRLFKESNQIKDEINKLEKLLGEKAFSCRATIIIEKDNFNLRELMDAIGMEYSVEIRNSSDTHYMFFLKEANNK